MATVVVELGVAGEAHGDVKAFWGCGVGMRVGDMDLSAGGTDGGEHDSRVILMGLSFASRDPPGQGDTLPLPPCSALLIGEYPLLPHGLPGKRHSLPD